MDERNFTGVFIPAKLYLDTNLSWIEKILIVEIEALTSEKEPCKASNEHFAKHLGITKGRVSKIISSLVQRGYIYIKIIKNKGNNNDSKRWLLVNERYSYFQLGGMVENDYRGIVENDYQNKVNNNNITPYNPPKGDREKFDENVFLKFWNAYPRRVSKGDAEKWFKKNKPTNDLVDLMIEKINILKKTEQWKQNNGKYIPYPASWLNSKGWEDEIQTNDSKPKYDTSIIYHDKYIGDYRLDEDGKRIFV